MVDNTNSYADTLNVFYSSIDKPTSLTCDDIVPGSESLIRISPVEKGLSQTLAVSIRRTALSMIRGVRVIGIKINDTLSEFDTVDSIREDVAHICINFKKISFESNITEPVTFSSVITKKGPIYSSDLSSPRGVKIVNKDVFLFNHESDEPIEISLSVSSGFGYQSSEESVEMLDQGFLPLDVFFSPVKNISYKVDSAKPSESIKNDSIQFNIKTDGSISPKDVFEASVLLIRENCKMISGVHDFSITQDIKKVPASSSNEALFYVINDRMELKSRAKKCFETNDIYFLGDLVAMKEVDLMKMPNFGRKSLKELRENLKRYSLELGSPVLNWKEMRSEYLKQHGAPIKF